jgi:hypothetical protein
VARTTEDPRRHYLGVRLTDSEQHALKLLAQQRGQLSLSDALRALIPKLLLKPSDAPAAVTTGRAAVRRRR